MQPAQVGPGKLLKDPIVEEKLHKRAANASITCLTLYVTFIGMKTTSDGHTLEARSHHSTARLPLRSLQRV